MEEAPTLPAPGRFPLPWRRRLPRFQHQDAFHCHNNVTLCNNLVKFNGVSTFSLSSLPFSLRSLDPSKSPPISCTLTHNTPCCIYISASNVLVYHDATHQQIKISPTPCPFRHQHDFSTIPICITSITHESSFARSFFWNKKSLFYPSIYRQRVSCSRFFYIHSTF